MLREHLVLALLASASDKRERALRCARMARVAEDMDTATIFADMAASAVADASWYARLAMQVGP